MKIILIIALFLFVFFLNIKISVSDAAIEAQEGNVDKWIEYYSKERGFKLEETEKKK